MTRSQETMLIEILELIEEQIIPETNAQSIQLEKLKSLIKEFRNDSEFDENHKYY